MKGLNILGNEEPKKPNQVQTSVNNPFKKTDNTPLVTIVMIMGLVLIAVVWLVSSPCPDVTCPEIEIPACPNVTIPSCPEMNCPDCNPAFICDNSTYYNNTCINTTTNITLTKLATNITIFNSTNTNQNITFSLTNNTTSEINTTTLGLGELIMIRVDYE